MALFKQIILAKGREASLRRRHPWIFSGAIERVTGDPQSGETVAVRSHDEEWLGVAAYSPLSQIRARLWGFTPADEPGPEFFSRRIMAAVEYRRALGLWPERCCRLIHGEADGLPALVVDRYGDFLACEFLGAGVELWKKEIVETLRQLPGIRGIYERSDADARRREGLPLRDGLLWGEMPPEDFTVCEDGLTLRLDVPGGHKTGFYLDQRENRRAIDPLSPGAEVLDCCCYSGAFGLRAALAGARKVTFLDGAQNAIELARANAALNGLGEDSRLEFIRGDMFTVLRKFRDSRRTFDVIVLDPPKFATTRGQLLKAAHGYKDINLLACKLLKPHGSLLTYSCSGAMTPEFFRTIVAEALTDAGRTARVLCSFSQAPDHPQSLAFPEGHYLTGLQLRLDE